MVRGINSTKGDTYKLEVIRRNVESSLKMGRIFDRVTIENNGNALSCSGNDIRLWFRVFYDNSIGAYNVEINTISLSDKLQRRGLFTLIWKRLNKCKYTNKLKIVSVCSESMHRWCIKHRLVTENNSDYYKF